MFGDAYQSLARDLLRRACLRGVIAGLFAPLAFAVPAWAGNPIAPTAGVVSVPSVVAGAARSAESTVASTTALTPQSPRGAAVEQTPVSAVAKQGLNDAAGAATVATGPTPVTPALDAATQASHVASQGVATLLPAVPAIAKAREALATTTQAVEDVSKGFKGITKGALAVAESASDGAAGTLASASRATGATVSAAQGRLAPGGRGQGPGPGAPPGSHGSRGVGGSAPNTLNRPMRAPASALTSAHVLARSGPRFITATDRTAATLPGFPAGAALSCRDARRAPVGPLPCHAGTSLIRRLSLSRAASSTGGAIASAGPPGTGPAPHGLAGRMRTAGALPAPSPPSPVPGGVSGSAAAGGLGLSTFLALAILCLLAAPRVVSQLRLRCEPGLRSAFVLIPERPG
jgi:hypothetical protein